MPITPKTGSLFHADSHQGARGAAQPEAPYVLYYSNGQDAPSHQNDLPRCPAERWDVCGRNRCNGDPSNHRGKSVRHRSWSRSLDREGKAQIDLKSLQAWRHSGGDTVPDGFQQRTAMQRTAL